MSELPSDTNEKPVGELQPVPASAAEALPQASATVEAPSASVSMLGILISPNETFRRIAGKGGWGFLLPFVILVIVGMVASLVFTHRVDMNEFLRQQIRESPRASKISPKQMDQAVDFSAKIVKLTTYGGFIVGLIKYLFVAMVLWLMVLAFGDEITFRDSFRVVCWSQVPNILFAMLAIGILFIRDPMTVDPKNFVMSNLGAILGKETLGKKLYALLTDLDVFTLWMLWLYSRGLSAFAKATMGKMVAIVFSLYGILVLVHVAWAAIF